MYKLIITDLDDTLVNSQGKISEVDKSAIIAAQKKGVKFVLSSGRPTFAILNLAKELELDHYGGYISSFNGSIIIDCKKNQKISEIALTEKEIHFIYDIAKRENVDIITYFDNSIISENNSEYIQEEIKITGMPLKKVNNFKNTIDRPCTKCILLAEPNYLAKVEKKFRKEFGNMFSITRSKEFFLEITKLGVDKGFGLKKLCELTNITLKECIAVGDSYNDLPMLKIAGLSVAVSNAKPEILNSVDFITKSNNNSGMAYLINSYIL